MFALEDYCWLVSDKGLKLWESLNEHATSEGLPLAQVKALRRTLPSPQAALLLQQWEFLAKAARKVTHPQAWFWTQQLLEQASDEQTARETALDFPENAESYDCCCGAGSDALALAARNTQLIAIDRDPIACLLTTHNTQAVRDRVQVLQQEIEGIDGLDNRWVHLDPDRRAAGKRTTRLDQLSPSWDSIAKMVQHSAGVSLKLAPATRLEHDPISPETPSPAPDAMRWISREGSVRQQRWYWKLDRWPAGSITASMQRGSGEWHHETFQKSEQEVAPENVSLQRPLRFVGDYDPAIRAAQASAWFAARYRWNLLGMAGGYLTSDIGTPHAALRWFEISDVLPLDRKKIRMHARGMSVRTWELKSRGIDIDIESMRRELPTDKQSETTATLLMTQWGGRYHAIFAKAVSP